MMTRRLLLAMMLLSALWPTGLSWPQDEAPKKFNLEVSTDFDYDANATQQPDNPAGAALVNKRGSAVYTQAAKLAYNVNPVGPLDLEGKYEFFQNFHPRVSTVDTLMHTWSLSPSYSFGAARNFRLWLPFSFNYTDVQSDKYLTAFALAPNFFHRYSQALGWGLEMWLGRKYGWTPQAMPGLFDYSGRNIGYSLGGYYFFGDKGGYLQARLSNDYVGAVGRNNDGSSFHLLLSGLYPFTPKFSLTLYLDLGLVPYDHRYQDGTLTAYPTREDKTMVFGAIASYEIYRGLAANLHYYMTRQDSNIFLYDYTTHILGGQVAYRY